MILFPQWTTLNIILYGWLAVMVLSVGFLEYYGLAMMNYSKFRPSVGLPGRTGMFILYFLPLAAVTAGALPYLLNASMVQWFVFGAVFLHFLKRVLEVLFVHKYSGPIGLFTTLLISAFYSFAAWLIGALNAQPLPKADLWFYFGVVLFVVGMVGNFIHHRILASLRKDSYEYAIPTGGWFEYVACPHYFFEIMIWLGIALLSRHLGSFLVLGFIVAYLSARNLRTLTWYRNKFPDFPPNRKAIFPHIL